MKKKTSVGRIILFVFLILLALAWIYPVYLILINSFKNNNAITTSGVFDLPTAQTFGGLSNFSNAINSQGFLVSLGYSTLITVTSVAAIILFCSMCAWYITLSLIHI